jgi:hypothetical protein
VLRLKVDVILTHDTPPVLAAKEDRRLFACKLLEHGHAPSG